MDAFSKSVTDATARPPRTSPPTMEELKREGICLYTISPGHELVYMLPDRSTWYARRTTKHTWTIINRNDMDD